MRGSGYSLMEAIGVAARRRSSTDIPDVFRLLTGPGIGRRGRCGKAGGCPRTVARALVDRGDAAN